MSTINFGDNLLLDSDYSTEEKPTGATWIDGKPIYRKVISTTFAPTASTWLNYNHNIANLGTVVSIGGTILTNHNAQVGVSGTSGTDFWTTFVFETFVSFWSSYARVLGQPIKVVLEYTKTTD